MSTDIKKLTIYSKVTERTTQKINELVMECNRLRAENKQIYKKFQELYNKVVKN